MTKHYNFKEGGFTDEEIEEAETLTIEEYAVKHGVQLGYEIDEETRKAIMEKLGINDNYIT